MLRFRRVRSRHPDGGKWSTSLAPATALEAALDRPKRSEIVRDQGHERPQSGDELRLLFYYQAPISFMLRPAACISCGATSSLCVATVHEWPKDRSGSQRPLEDRVHVLDIDHQMHGRAAEHFRTFAV